MPQAITAKAPAHPLPKKSIEWDGKRLGEMVKEPFRKGLTSGSHEARLFNKTEEAVVCQCDRRDAAKH
jgi:hypothetical protein